MPENGLVNKLGEILVNSGIITKEEMESLLEKQKTVRKRIGELAIEEGLATEKDVAQALATQLGIPYVNLESVVIEPAVASLIPETMARELKAIPIFRVENNLTVAMADPTDSEAIKEIRFVTGCKVEPVVSGLTEIIKTIDTYYGKPDSVRDTIEDLTTSVAESVEEIEEEDLSESERLSQEAPVVKLVNLIIERAVDRSASDIHVEPEENGLRVRYRVDGVLQEDIVIPKMLRAAVISRLKILAKMNIAERRVPQDGRFSVKVRGKKVDIRVSTFPTIHGEKVVMRLLERSGSTLSLEDLGMSPNILRRFEQVLSLSHGIILVTGPTGSGKSTTLYAALNRINTPEKNIVTLEDPVESQISGVNQGHTNPIAGFTFASGLRAILRQDPDIIMVGETRDVETAEIAIQAALTGHLVFTTIHTNDAVAAITRLVDMGIEPFLVSSSVSAIVAQRLVRKVCPQCAQKGEPVELTVPDTGEVRRLESVPVPVGCEKCGNLGYKGRIGLFELVVANDEIRRLIVRKANEQELRAVARKYGYRTMFEDGIDKVEAGVTTVEEVMRVTRTTIEEEIVATGQTA